MTKELQQSVIECVEAKLQLCDLQISLVSNQSTGADPILPSLRIIKDRWSALKHFSLYNLYQECDQTAYDFGSEEEMMAHLCKASDSKIDSLINMDREKELSRDALVPSLCYDLLMENAELRKM